MADEKALSEMDELSLLRLAGKKFNVAAEVSNRLKASAAKAGLIASRTNVLLSIPMLLCMTSFR